MLVFTGWLFASSCSPPRLSATQLLSATKGQLPAVGTFTQLLECAHGRTSTPVPGVIVRRPAGRRHSDIRHA